MHNMILVKKKDGWTHTQWFDKEGNEYNLPHNFRAKEADTGREVIVIFHSERIREMAGTLDVVRAKVFDAQTLEPLGFKRNREGYTSSSFDSEDIFYEITAYEA